MIETKKIFDKFNEMLHDGKHSREEAYQYLQMEQYRLEYEFYKEHGFYMDMGFNFLYPERIFNFLYPERIDLDGILTKLPENQNNKKEE